MVQSPARRLPGWWLAPAWDGPALALEPYPPSPFPRKGAITVQSPARRLPGWWLARKGITLAALVLAGAAPLLGHPAHAGSHAAAVALDATYVSECGSCHTAYPPGALAANAWRALMGTLDKHFGDNASVDAPERAQIETWLVAHAGAPTAALRAGETPRLTRSAWFERKHRELPTALWRDARIGRAGNCAACHTHADAGRYSEREIRLPAGLRWED